MTVDGLRSELAALAGKLERKKKIDAMLLSLQDEERVLSEHERRLKAVLFKEETDVDRLERTSAASILHSMLGDRVEKLDKEKQEAFAAGLKYDAATRQLDDCRKRMDALRGERDSLSRCESEYDRLYARLHDSLGADPAYADRLCIMERQRGEAAGQLKELAEAIAAGEAVMLQTERMVQLLDRAGSYEMFRSHAITSFLNRAQAEANKLQPLLRRFHTELADVRIRQRLKEVVGDYLKFADFFFDGWPESYPILIHDLMESVLEVQRNVDGVMSELTAMQASRHTKKIDLEKQIEKLITKD